MAIPDNFNPNGITKIKPLDENATLVSYGDGKPSVVITATSSEVMRYVDEAKARAADSEE